MLAFALVFQGFPGQHEQSQISCHGWPDPSLLALQWSTHFCPRAFVPVGPWACNVSPIGLWLAGPLQSHRKADFMGQLVLAATLDAPLPLGYVVASILIFFRQPATSRTLILICCEAGPLYKHHIHEGKE